MKKYHTSLLLLFTLVASLSGCLKQIAPEGIGPTYLEEGLIAYEQGKWDQAISFLDQAIEDDPDSTEAFFKRGVIFQRLEKPGKAIQSYKAVVRIDRKHFKAHYNLGNLYAYEKQDTVQAVFHYRRFLAMAPGHPMARKARKKIKEMTAVPGDVNASSQPFAIPNPGADFLPAAGVLLQPPLTPPALVVAPLTKGLAETVLPIGSEAQASVSVPPVVALAPPVSVASELPLSFPEVVCLSGQVDGKKVEGSGFVIAKNGYILASRHQIERASRLMARFEDGSLYPATLLSVSEQFDLALLQIPLRGNPILAFVLSSSPKVGSPVLAVGCPFGLSHSVSRGIVSAPERKIGRKMLLQTDVAVNPGSSGGPLLNNDGAVLGVVVGVLPKARGISFSLPAREARLFLGETFLQIGTLFAESKRYDEAVEALRSSGDFWPGSAKAHSNLGEVYRRMQNFEAAERSYLKSIAADALYADAHFNLGILYDNHLQSPGKAAKYYRNYLKLRPRSSDATQVSQWLSDAEARQ